MPKHTTVEQVNNTRVGQMTPMTPVQQKPAGGPAHTTSTKSGPAPKPNMKNGFGA